MKKTQVLTELESRLRSEVLFLDGAMGTVIQLHKLEETDFRGARFKNHHKDLKGNNDLLVLTRPDLIEQIHLEYLNAGADIIETNTFNANRISQKDYDLEDISYELNKVAAQIAKQACQKFLKLNPDHKPVYVAGALGPTNRTASLSPDVNNPSARAVTFDELKTAYKEQAHGLLDGGADILLPETTFDTLNLKACLFAISEIQQERQQKLPLMISVTITDASGRTLSGQTVEAFWNSVRHSEPLSVGINCALGAAEMEPHLKELSRVAGDTFISCYPNAGLPNPLSPTGYDETPESLALHLKRFIDQGLANVVGGCCGTTPSHIQKIVEYSKNGVPRKAQPIEIKTRLAGLEPLNLNSSGDRSFVMVGERTNVTGSPKFAKLVRENKLSDGLEIARQQVESGANILDINFDEGMIDGKSMMQEFCNLLASEPEISKIPFMIDSSKWEILEAGLKCIQGKAVVNSISLKEGEENFLKQAGLIRRYGAAVIVMAFDEKGQAATQADKVSICQRAYHLLVDKADFPPEDIIFDPNVLTISTGLVEHNNYAVDFIEAIRVLKKTCPHSLTSGGISNLSFSFRGQNKIREALHGVFLFHAIKAGLDMGIVNAGMLEVYDEIPSDLRAKSEAVILNTHTQASEDLLTLAAQIQAEQSSSTKDPATATAPEWRTQTLQERITHAFLKGIDTHIIEDTQEAYSNLGTPLKVIEGPLMNAMKVVGELFGQGKMFLPQVVKSARVMKKAVGHLEPYMQADRAKSQTKSQGKVLLATVKGDVHDIGKNIVGVVLACNGYEVIDLGVMISLGEILKAAKEHQVDMIGLSGLITPSLEEMQFNLTEFQKSDLKVPVLIGGATTSKVHTAVKLDPHYSGPVTHVADASLVVEVCNRLLHSSQKIAEWDLFKKENLTIRESYLANQKLKAPCLSIEEARKKRPQLQFDSKNPGSPDRLGTFNLQPNLETIVKYIDWSPLFWAWELKGTYPKIFEHPKWGEEAKKLFDDAQILLRDLISQKKLDPSVRIGLFPAAAHNETVYVWDHTVQNSQEKATEKSAIESFVFPRQRHESVINNDKAYSLADFIAPKSSSQLSTLGFFVVTAGHNAEKVAQQYKDDKDDYSSILVKAIADRLAEALAEWAHHEVRKLFAFGKKEHLTLSELISEKYQGIRPAPGYPSCPLHQDKLKIWKLLDAEATTKVRLTETLAMSPASSVSGFYFFHPESKYFHVGPQDL